MCEGKKTLREEIQQAQEELNQLINAPQLDKEKIYEYSCKLDKLINEFYACTVKGSSEKI